MLAIVLACGGASAMQAGADEVAAPLDELDPKRQVAPAIIDLAGWVIARWDNRGLPYAVIDKKTAQIVVFGADNRVLGLAPVLIGSAEGDHSAPGIGDRELSDIPAEDRTTPAGRFYAAYGPATGGQRVLWVDYDTAVSLHPIPPGATSQRERRKSRLASGDPKDNRITHGCINVSDEFYEKIVRPLFAKGGAFYVIPDATPMDKAFPGYRITRTIASAAEANDVTPIEVLGDSRKPKR